MPREAARLLNFLPAYRHYDGIGLQYHRWLTRRHTRPPHVPRNPTIDRYLMSSISMFTSRRMVATLGCRICAQMIHAVFLVIATYSLALPAVAGIADGSLSGKRYALVIGNNAYKDAPLTNPARDAAAMANALKELGFSVTLLTNATLPQMSDAARQFGDRLGAGDVGLFYYAGHGMQIKGRNFLIPVDADIRREDEVQYKSFDANQMLDKMESAHNPINIVILDACRNNPFNRSFRSASSGLAQMDAPVGSYISFATAPGRIASDGEGENGLYTQHLLNALKTPNLKLEDVFKHVRLKVIQDSNGQQIPWDSSSLTGDFYFIAGDGVAPTATAGSNAPLVPSVLSRAPGRAAGDIATTPATKTEPRERKSVETKPGPTPQELALTEEYFRKGQDAQKRGDVKAALDTYEAAAERGHAGAQYELAQLYKYGRPPARQDLAAARKWFLKAAEQGNPAAQYEAGKAYAAGQGGDKSCKEAERWLRKAADRAHPDAMLQLGWIYQRGCDGDKNPVEAARWLKAAAGKGLRDAQFSLGVLYFNGDGVGKDPKEARKWLEAAAAQGHPSTRLYLDRLQ